MKVDSVCPDCGGVRQIKVRSEADRYNRPCGSCAATKRNKARAAAGHYARPHNWRNQHSAKVAI